MPLVRARRSEAVSTKPVGDVIAQNLQDAIAELASEKATKAEVVNLTDDQSIAGDKTFSGSSTTLNNYAKFSFTDTSFIDVAQPSGVPGVRFFNAGSTSRFDIKNFGTYQYLGYFADNTSRGGINILPGFKTGINTNTPGSSLQIFGSFSISTTASAVSDPGNGNAFISGNLAVGDAVSPTSTLRIASSTKNILAEFVGNGSNAFKSIKIISNVSHSVGLSLESQGGIKWTLLSNFPIGTNRSFQIYNEQNATIPFFINGDSDNIGIGTGVTNTGAKLQVAGGVAITSSTSAATDPGAGNLRVEGGVVDSYKDGGAQVNAWSNNTGSGSLISALRCNGTLASPTAVTNGAVLGQFRFLGHDGTTYRTAATIACFTTEAWTSTARGNAIIFSSILQGTASPGERMRIHSNGYLGVGTPTPGCLAQFSGGGVAITSSTAAAPDPGAGNLSVAGSGIFNGGTLTLNNATSNHIIFNNINGLPTLTTRSVGTRLVLDNKLNAGNLDYAIGIASACFWFSIPQPNNTNYYSWYGNTTEIMRLGGGGALSLPTASSTFSIAGTTASTSTTTGALVVAGGAGISGSVNADSIVVGGSTILTGGFYGNGAYVPLLQPVGVGGTNQNGINLTINAGLGTGTGTPGSIFFRTTDPIASGTTQQTYSLRGVLLGNGSWGFGTITPGCHQFSSKGVAIASSSSAATDPGAGNLSVTGTIAAGNGFRLDPNGIFARLFSNNPIELQHNTATAANPIVQVSKNNGVVAFAETFLKIGGTNISQTLNDSKYIDANGKFTSWASGGVSIQSATTGAVNPGAGNLLVSNNVSADSFDLANTLLIKKTATKTTTDATPTELFLDAANTQRLIIPNNTTWYFELRVAGRRTNAAGEGGSIKIRGSIYKDTTAASTTIVSTTKETFLGGLTWDANVAADPTNGALRITVTGATGSTINWSSSIQIVQAS